MKFELVIGLVAVILSLGMPIVLGFLFAKGYQNHRKMQNAERLAMIEKGMQIDFSKDKKRRIPSFRWPLLLTGAGLGLVIGIIYTGGPNSAEGELIPALMLLFAGVGFLVGTFMDKKSAEKALAEE